MNFLGILIFFGIPMVPTVFATALLCRLQIARKRRVSYGTMFLGAVIGPVLLSIALTSLYPEIWSTSNKGPGVERMLAVFGFSAVLCVLPALAVVNYYQNRGQKAEITTH